MGNGKRVCEILKNIRKEIAKANHIEYSPIECTFQGECTGTCPACEAELQYLEAELNKKRESGERVYLKDIAKQIDWNRHTEMGNIKKEPRQDVYPLMGICPDE